jgi:hypothetical protein
MKYQRPSESELPAELAKEMGWKYMGANGTPRGSDVRWCGCGMEETANSDSCCNYWNPLTDRNHSGLAVERCAELGLDQHYVGQLCKENPPFEADGLSWRGPETIRIARATPAHESYAAHRVLWEHNRKEIK